MVGMWLNKRLLFLFKIYLNDNRLFKVKTVITYWVKTSGEMFYNNSTKDQRG